MKNLEIHLCLEELTTCPKYKNRAGLIKDLFISQQHKYLSLKCNYQFILQFDNENKI
jgi:hypothetical protein